MWMRRMRQLPRSRLVQGASHGAPPFPQRSELRMIEPPFVRGVNGCACSECQALGAAIEALPTEPSFCSDFPDFTGDVSEPVRSDDIAYSWEPDPGCACFRCQGFYRDEPKDGCGPDVAMPDGMLRAFTEWNEREPDVLTLGRKTARGERQEEYGDPTQNLRNIGRVWAGILDLEDDITAREVALMMVGMKALRAAGRMNDDDLVDVAGYVLLASEAE